jgi:hypothetical protein
MRAEGRCVVSPVPGRIALASEETVEALARAVPARFYALVLLLRFTGLRWAEAVALRRRRCFVVEGSIEVAERAVVTASGVRFRFLSARDYGWVALRGDVRDALAVHLACFVPKHRNALVFSDEAGAALVRKGFERDVWFPALTAVGLPEEDHGIDTLGAARLWEWMHETTAQRASLRAGSNDRQGATNG